MIQRGYERRHRQLWGATRWQTYNLMCAFAGSKALRDAGINSVKDLLPFPWEKDKVTEILSNEDIQELQYLMENENKKNKGATN